MPVTDRLRSLIVQSIERSTDAHTVTPDARLADLGLDSVSGLSLLLAMEEEFDVTFPEDLLTNDVFESLASLETALKALGVE